MCRNSFIVAVFLKDGMFHVGKVLKDKEVFDRPVIEQAYYLYFYDGIKDTYGNVYGKSIVFKYNGNFTTFHAGREYSYFKCIVAMQDGYKGSGSFQIIADDEVIYTSSEITNLPAFLYIPCDEKSF